MKLYRKLINQFLLVTTIGLVAGCQDDFLDTESGENITEEQIGKSATAGTAILNGVYASLRTYGQGGTTNHTDYGLFSSLNYNEMAGQDVVQPTNHWWGAEHIFTGRVETNSRTRVQWNTAYSIIKELNVVINNTDPATADDDALAVLGQALAVRGMLYHNLARFYAKSYSNPTGPCVPLQLGTTGFEDLPRATVEDVYNQIILDLETAVTYLADFDRTTKQQVDANVANGFLARAYLEVGRYADAAAAALAAIDGYPMTSNQDYLESGFSNITLPWVMWGADIDAESTTIYASFFSHFCNTCPGYTGALGIYKHIDKSLYDKIPATDIRKSMFVAPGDPDEWDLPDLANVKFRDATFFEGDYIWMRPEEMSFIRAEALARSGNEPGARDILDDIGEARDPNYVATVNTGQALLDEINIQKRIELWGEGHTGIWEMNRLQQNIDRTYAGTNHGSYARLAVPFTDNRRVLQIPILEIQANSKISEGDQNPL